MFGFFHALTRVAILNGISSDAMLRIWWGEGLPGTQLKERARDAAKRVLGISVCKSLRDLIVRAKLRYGRLPKTIRIS